MTCDNCGARRRCVVPVETSAGEGMLCHACRGLDEGDCDDCWDEREELRDDVRDEL